jgi:hypothetical protein
MRLLLQVLQRLGSFLNCLSWKNSCSPAVKMKSPPQSMHLSTLSWNSIERCLPSPHLPDPYSPRTRFDSPGARKSAGSITHTPRKPLGSALPCQSGMGTEDCYQSPAVGGLGRLKGPGRKQLRREEGRHEVRATRRQRFSLVPYELFFGSACEPAPLSLASSRQVSGKRSVA